MSEHKNTQNTIWSLLGAILQQASDAFSAIIESVRTFLEGDAQTRRQVAFSVAMIALSAKMAKADGIVSDSEVKAFYEIIKVDEKDLSHVARLFSLAKGDIAGFEYYAHKIAYLCKDNECEGNVLEDVLDGLFHIAKADGYIHQNEMAFLHNVSEIFGINQNRFETISAYHAQNGQQDPWTILGIDKTIPFQDARKRYHQLVQEHHPDKLTARGMPIEFSAIANERLASINTAWATVKKELRPS